MGSSCGCSQSNVEKNAKEISRYRKSISDKLKTYSFDSSNPKEFINKVCKENNINEQTAAIWIDLYLYYMILVGFNYDKTPTKSVKTRMAEKFERMLAIPYELLQIWKTHILYTKKYEEFCDIVTKGGEKCIPFYPPKTVWKSGDPNEINNYFRFNHSVMAKAFDKKKSEFDSLFVFQSAYLKNTLHYCFCENIGDNLFTRIVTAYNNEANNQNGIFKMTTRDISSIKVLSTNIEQMIFRNCVPNENEGYVEWNVTNNVYGTAIQKVPVFQNLNLPRDFTTKFMEDHLLSRKKANEYISEYKKFLFCAFIGNISLCPSEQVDLVWHYHQLHTKEYREFSKMIMNTEVYGHNPSDGTEKDFNKYKEVYNTTLNYITSAFGNLNPEVWPNVDIRFSQIYRWYNHHQFMAQTKIWKEGNIVTTTKVVHQNVLLGCYIG